MWWPAVEARLVEGSVGAASEGGSRNEGATMHPPRIDLSDPLAVKHASQANRRARLSGRRQVRPQPVPIEPDRNE